ncbi:hypothetical protein OHA84_38200 (plasmid) [Streptomyces sp. NBC_00513]|nr:hypothetical protein [Streptomyces sp. NBC_00424]WUD46365.1 hypothetical protein OHA84_38200 [Streptomyces sp. NBC_00513]
MQYNYTDTGLGRYAHQIDTSMYSGWGDATKATIDGQATLTGPCTRTSATFPAKPLSPVNSWNTGESFFDSSLVGPATKGKCKTMWYLTFNNAGYDPAVVDYSMNEVRCDNATAGRPGIGCVIPWVASNLVYTRTATPELADHVTKAQASGLPSRLTRTEDQTVIDSNRTKACGSAPSVPGKSCDEYPIATSEQGLNAGGTRRTHPGCGFTGVPAGTGPVGASVCMIAATGTTARRAARTLSSSGAIASFRATRSTWSSSKGSAGPGPAGAAPLRGGRGGDYLAWQWLRRTTQGAVMTIHQAPVFVNEGTFGIFDHGEVPIESADWSGDLIAPMSAGAMVRTGINTGNVQVEVRTGPSQVSSGEWEEAATAQVWSPTGSLRIESVVDGPQSELPVLSASGPGWYELEVKARGRRQAPDASLLESAEAYLITLRPVPEKTPPAPAGADTAPDPDEEARRRRLLQG